ncbi:hypothetical protein [Paenibacillus sp. FSL L8-0506]|uniref:hypothetical protein n=1 Tax=Paenibacillus sp. FSL L8-0506 TaxID=2975335 RepID=UPI0030FB31E8
MFNWSVLLTSTVVSAVFTGVVSVLIKGRLDRKLEKNKQQYEKEKLIFSTETQKNIEKLKSDFNQLSSLKQKNLEYYHSMNQNVQSKRVSAIETVWCEYLDLRKYVSPLINFFSIVLPKEYFNIIEKLEMEDKLLLKSLDDRVIPSGLDTTPFLYNLEIQRPFLGEIIYFKFRSSILILYRLRLMYFDMVKKKNLYFWNEDTLILDHIDVVFSTDTLSIGETPLSLDSPLKLLQLIGAIELELNRTIDRVISGEVGAELSLERLKKLNQGYR